MTIQESMYEKLRKAKIMGFLFWLAFSLTIFLPFDKEYFFLSLIPFLGFGGVAMYILFLIRCPQCKASLGRACMGKGNFFKLKTRLHHCPDCGVDLNKSM